MLNKVVLLDLENNMPTAKMLRDIIQHYSTLYLFNCQGRFEYTLEDLTELASWISSGQIVILETLKAQEKEFEYAVVVGQLIALLEPDTHVEIISAMPSSEILVQMMSASDLSCSLSRIKPENIEQASKYKIPSIATINEKPYLQMVKRYCDALGKMTGKPNTVEKLRNSVGNILQVVPENAQHLVGMLINLKIIKRDEEQVSVRKKVLRQWTQLNLDEEAPESKVESIDKLLEKLQSNTHTIVQDDEQANSVQSIQQGLFKNFEKIDPMQIKVMHKLHTLKSEKPKDIYALRDLLEQMFPKSDVRLLLKDLVEKGYISWNGRAVIYSHEMFLN
ncbi:hypothetical protein [Acinetobacter silvestris]|uniref:PIN-like domain-containing protein n=1 Tax=Acinetobacter silvestris TaxID=1977882 RepID=A0A1Y3CNF4_9GAMM|nr:hypothetical protein [Acinetobacter silvestris]OTG67413.1 hypothetical protein B9T28_01945 [Acinetobacter silvestris]